MAAITQFDPYSVLARKIGYSVGLEHLARNVRLLVDTYVGERRLTYAAWLELVTSKDKFGRNTSAVKHFANLYLSLGILRMVGREVHSLHRLDCLAVLRRLLKDDAQFTRALEYVLTIAIMESDGDIFLNALARDFDLASSSIAIKACLEIKWRTYLNVLPSKGGQEKLWDKLRIKSFKMDVKPGAAKSGVRTEAIDSALKNLWREESSYDLSVPMQYVEKALPPRRLWATDCGLLGKDAKKTQRGIDLLRLIETIGIVEQGVVVFWPYEHELNAIKIDPSKIGKHALHSWNVLSAVAVAWESEITGKRGATSKLTDFVGRVYAEYRAGDITKQLLRQQLPLFLLYPTYTGYCVGRGEPHEDLPKFLDKMYKAPERLFNFVAIRGTEGGLQVKKAAK
jgi:hypothetical protein